MSVNIDMNKKLLNKNANAKYYLRNKVAEIYKQVFDEVLGTKKEYLRRLVLKELDVKTGADERAVQEFAKEVIEKSEIRMYDAEI